MNILTAVILSSLVLFTLSIFIIFNLLKKVERYEELNEQLSQEMSLIRENSIKLFMYIQESKKFIDDIDERGIYQADDEVGTFFNTLKNIQKVLNDIITKPDAEEENQ